MVRALERCVQLEPWQHRSRLLLASLLWRHHPGRRPAALKLKTKGPVAAKKKKDGLPVQAAGRRPAYKADDGQPSRHTLVEQPAPAELDVTHCRFGNGTSAEVFRPSTNDTVACNASDIGSLNLPDGADFSETNALAATGGSATGSTQQGFLPILLSRDGETYFFTAMTF